MTRKPKGQDKGKGKSPAKRKTPAKGEAKTTGPKAARARPAKPKSGKKSPLKPTPKGRPRAAATRDTGARAAAQLHWLVRPETIRKLWIWGGIVLAAMVGVELWVHMHGYFGIDGTFAFNAWYGFAACVAMILGAKALGLFLKREDTYYGDD